ncbi:hypothetical protein R1sor_022845 [Riccia sorocarpa]|uniref:Uncharacterized protein n=1 Tax=Riccia sorocarpa TaxID=122646 RepID=A0ABD3GN74_9MARC
MPLTVKPLILCSQGMAAGTHLLEVVAMGCYISPVRVDVSARLHGQRREPFSLVGLLKSPMGLMVGVMVVAVFLLAKLMESIDPEDMKRVQKEMRNQPTPSFNSLLQGRG